MCIKETPASEDSDKDRCATKSLHICVVERQFPLKFVLARVPHSSGIQVPLFYKIQAFFFFLVLGAQDNPTKANRGKETNRSSGTKIPFLFLTLSTFIFLCFKCVIQCNTNFSLLSKLRVHHLVSKWPSVLEKATKTYTILKKNNRMSRLHHSGWEQDFFLQKTLAIPFWHC